MRVAKPDHGGLFWSRALKRQVETSDAYSSSASIYKYMLGFSHFSEASACN